mmetsp:Transcript_16680/g.36129  ORF Transcript_16680/g.36129 Transcript_16680/m.36129 type:complete len:233 (-) Transcript_16680:263-961(-)
MHWRDLRWTETDIASSSCAMTKQSTPPLLESSPSASILSSPTATTQTTASEIRFCAGQKAFAATPSLQPCSFGQSGSSPAILSPKLTQAHSTTQPHPSLTPPTPSHCPHARQPNQPPLPPLPSVHCRRRPTANLKRMQHQMRYRNLRIQPPSKNIPPARCLPSSGVGGPPPMAITQFHPSPDHPPHSVCPSPPTWMGHGMRSPLGVHAHNVHQPCTYARHSHVRTRNGSHPQ